MNFQYTVKTGLKITVYLRPIVGGPTVGCGTVMQSTGQGIRGMVMRGTHLLLPPREITVYWIDGGRRRWLAVSPRWDDQGSKHSQALGEWLSAAGSPLSRLGVGGEGIIGVKLG